MPKLTYLPDNREVEAKLGDTILQTSLNHDISHTHVCGSNARRTTCRVIVLEGLQKRRSLFCLLTFVT